MFPVREALILLCLFPTLTATVYAQELEDSSIDLVIKAQQDRIELIERIAPSVVCIFDANQRGGGSGVIISPEGYGLSNFHVLAGMLKTRKGLGGLLDGKLYDIEVLGIDPTGDVAMFRMIGKDTFEYVTLGDSDAIEIGDSVIAMGNPFVMSEDYTPSVTTGIVTGTHRYQWGVGNNLIYSDCIQVDAAINPGNSGGPLFNHRGEVIGINGRISVNTRGRYNVGFGYAISSNQIKRFMPALRSGQLAKHGTLGAMVENDEQGGVYFSRSIPNGAAHRAGIILNDLLLAIDGIPVRSRNHFASVMGTYPANWPVHLDIERLGEKKRLITRLHEFQPKLKQPFMIQRDIILREVARVIHKHNRAALGNNSTAADQTWKWTIQRRYLTGDLQPAHQEKYLVTRETVGPITMRRQYDDGSMGATIQYDDHTATQKIKPDGEAFDLSVERSLVHRALYVMQHHLLLSSDRLDLVEVSHVGGDALFFHEIDLLNQPVGQEKLARNRNVNEITDSPTTSTILEVLTWPIGGDTRAKFGFDTITGELIKISIFDKISENEIVILMDDYQDVGGVRWPGRMFVIGASESYVDRLTDWEISP